MARRLSAALLVATLSIIVAGCVDKDASGSSDGLHDSTLALGPRPTPEVIASAVDSFATRVVAESLTPALGIAIVMDGRTVFSKSYGVADVTNHVPADDHTLWYVASTSKSFTGFGASLLANQGVIDFRAPITSLLPRARWPDGYDAHRFTLAKFLSHTHELRDNAIVMSASFTGEFPESGWPEMLRFAIPTQKPDLAYSNLGYLVAAMVIDAKRPEGWRRYLDSAVYKPAGMTETYTRISGLDPHRIAMPHDLIADGGYVTRPFQKIDATMNPAGGHLATMRDLARWVAVQMDSGVIDGKRVFPAEAVALSHHLIARQTRDKSRSFAFFRREGWAAGWDIGSYRGESMVSRFGSYASLRSHLSFLPGRHIGVVAQANGSPASTATDVLAAFAYDLERGDPNARSIADERLRKLLGERREALAEKTHSDSVRASRPPTLRRPLSDFAGSYDCAWYGTLKFEVRGNNVYYKWGALSGTAEIIDARSCGWLGCRYYNALIIDVGGDTAVEFDFPESGPATALKLKGETFIRK